MLSKLAKIANRLDSIGLTKEADVLDAFIRKAADGLDGGDYDTETSVPTKTSVPTVTSSNIDLVSEDIANNINTEKPSINRTDFIIEFMKRFTGSSAKPSYDPNNNWGKDAAYKMAAKQWDLLQSKVSPSDKSNSAPATGWEAYVSKTGTMGMEVKKAWVRYTQSGTAGVDPSFKSFTSWYNNQLKNMWGGKHKSPSEVIKILNERTTGQAMAGAHFEATPSSSMVAGTAANPFSGAQGTSRDIISPATQAEIDANLGRAWTEAGIKGPTRYNNP